MRNKFYRLGTIGFVLILAGLAAFVLAPALVAEKEPSNVFVVNTTDDTIDVNQGDGICADINGNCSLRAAIEEVNGNTPPYPSLVSKFREVRSSNNPPTIQVPSGIYPITIGKIDVLTGVIIMGDNPATTIVQANIISQVNDIFHIDSSDFDFTINGLTMHGAQTAIKARRGIQSLTINNCIFTNNSYGIFLWNGWHTSPIIHRVTVQDSTFLNNSTSVDVRIDNYLASITNTHFLT